MKPLSSDLSELWRSPAEAVFSGTIVGLSGGCWTLPGETSLEIPPLDQMRLIVNLAPLESHRLWSEGKMRRSGASSRGAIRIAPAQERIRAEVHGSVMRFAQVYIPKSALLAVGLPPLHADQCSAFRQLDFDVIDPVVMELVCALLIETGDPTEALYRDQMAAALLVHLYHRYGDAPVAISSSGRLDPRRLRLVIDYLENVEDTPSIRELSNLVGLSPHHFARAFRLSTGCAPHAWLRNVRMEKAKRALRQTNASVTEIALDCGYASPSTFTAAFTRITGRSPTSWRRRT